MRILATDIDGTIVCPASAAGPDVTTSGMSPRTIHALQAAAAAGVIVVLVTGRPIRWLEHIRSALSGCAEAICFNGAAHYDLRSKQVLAHHALELPTLLAARQRILDYEPRVSFAAETLHRLHLDSYCYPGQEPLFTPEGVVAEDFQHSLVGADAVVKLLAKTRHRGPDEFLADVQGLLGHQVVVTRSAPELSLVEIAAAKVDKAAMLARLAAQAGISPAEVVAIGDMPNDVAMLRWAGTSYAMASGHPAAQAAADHLAPACAADGVAQVVEFYLKNQRLPQSAELEF